MCLLFTTQFNDAFDSGGTFNDQLLPIAAYMYVTGVDRSLRILKQICIIDRCNPDCIHGLWMVYLTFHDHRFLLIFFSVPCGRLSLIVSL